MDIRYIVFGMMTVLAFLFIGAKFFIPVEKNKAKNEALFVESVKAFKSTPNQENYNQCLERAKGLSYLKNKKDEDLKAYLEKQGITFS